MSIDDESYKFRAKKAVHIAFTYGTIDGAHHKMWVIDQMVRELLTKDEYDKFLELLTDDDCCEWDQGIAP